MTGGAARAKDRQANGEKGSQQISHNPRNEAQVYYGVVEEEEEEATTVEDKRRGEDRDQTTTTTTTTAVNKVEEVVKATKKTKKKEKEKIRKHSRTKSGDHVASSSSQSPPSSPSTIITSNTPVASPSATSSFSPHANPTVSFLGSSISEGRSIQYTYERTPTTKAGKEKGKGKEKEKRRGKVRKTRSAPHLEGHKMLKPQSLPLASRMPDLSEPPLRQGWLTKLSAQPESPLPCS